MGWFKFRKKKNLNFIALANAKTGDLVNINGPIVTSDIVYCRVENNSPEEKKIFIALNYKKETHSCMEKKVFHYSDHCLRNYNTLNTQREKNNTPSAKEFLEDKITQAIIEENYEEADKLKKAIDILTK